MKAEIIYVVLIAIIAAIGGYVFAPGRELALTDMVLVNVVGISIKLIFAGSTLFALRGTKYDVLAEIFDRKNVAAAVFTGLLILSLVAGK